MANKTLNTRQKPVFRAPAPLANRKLPRDKKAQRAGAPATKPKPALLSD